MRYHSGTIQGQVVANIEKLYLKALNSPNNLDFKDLLALAKGVGFIPRKRAGTSHEVFKHPHITGLKSLLNLQEDSGKAKPYQVKQLIALIDEYDLLE
jgi:hypothetical protein